MAGNTEKRTLSVPSPQSVGFAADIWVFVDGRCDLRRGNIRCRVWCQVHNVAIRDHNRYLTLVASDAGNTCLNDWVMFGDPHLEVVVCPKAEPTAEEAVGK